MAKTARRPAQIVLPLVLLLQTFADRVTGSDLPRIGLQHQFGETPGFEESFTRVQVFAPLTVKATIGFSSAICWERSTVPVLCRAAPVWRFGSRRARAATSSRSTHITISANSSSRGRITTSTDGASERNCWARSGRRGPTYISARAGGGLRMRFSSPTCGTWIDFCCLGEREAASSSSCTGLTSRSAGC